MEKWTFHYLKQTCSVSGKVTSFVMQLKMESTTFCRIIGPMSRYDFYICLSQSFIKFHLCQLKDHSFKSLYDLSCF